MKILIISLTLLILASAGVASPLCAGGTHLDQYIANYSGISNACQIGDKLFYDFSFSPPTGSIATAAGTAVLPDPGDGVTNPGIVFSNGAFMAFSGQTLDITIGYSIATISGSAVIDGYSLALAGSDSPAGLGGTGSVTETFSNNPTGTPLVTTLGVNATANTSFQPWVSGTTVTTQIHLQSAGLDLVSISAVREHFSEVVPEPYETLLIGSGLLFFGLYRKRGATKR